jgi:hypothetical protein
MEEQSLAVLASRGSAARPPVAIAPEEERREETDARDEET